ncbi:MAG TPA: ATPase, T2SS/T4P/T4SS family, partial [Polyangiaceae bacterium]|nr:ATPase, T2SS/T4P/T4SS family [Polyangiaceae bacterium]
MDVQVVIEGRNGERRQESLSVQGPLSIGRDTQCTLCVPGELVSRKHARIELGETTLRVEDTSSNGTLAGVAVLRKTATEVPYGTPIVIGHYALYIHPGTDRTAPSPIIALEGAAEPATAAAAEAPESEPPPTPQEIAIVPQTTQTGELRREIHRRLLEHLDLATTDAARLDDPAFRPRVLVALRRIVSGLAERLPEGCDSDRLIGEMADEVLGLGPLEALIADPTVSEIMVIDASTIYVERNGKIERSTASFTDEDRVRAVIERIVTPLGRRIDESSPLVDARLPDGSRVNAIIKPLAIRGSCITIRKFARVPLTLQKLHDLGALTPAMGRFLTRSV